GKDTEKVVKKFQKDKGLIVNGIADSPTLKIISQLVNSNNQKPGTTVTEKTLYNISFNEALKKQTSRPLVITDKYRNNSNYPKGFVSTDYARLIDNAKITGNPNIRSKPIIAAKYKMEKIYRTGDTVKITGYDNNGSIYDGSTLWYEIQ